jgi:Zn-dependent peptidase ImmA (M78 family)/transcriptional regulator with XRE-family HTH domain
MIGERVRHARSYHGLTQSELADRIGVAQSTISKIEQGREPAPDVVEKVAIATGFDHSFFERGPLPDLPEGSLQFRKLSSATVRDSDAFRAVVRQTVEVVDQILADAPKLRIPEVRVEPVLPTLPLVGQRDVDLSVDVDELAARARTWLGVGRNDPIPNVVRAVERAGVVVLGTSHEVAGHSGGSFWPDYPVGRPLICFTRGQPGDRQRFTVAHELGHLALHQLRTPQSQSVAEREANDFAGALLLPLAAAEALPRPVTLKVLAAAKAKWGISMSAIVQRCLRLGIIDAERGRSLHIQLSSRGWKKNEPVHVATEEPTLLRRMIELASGGLRYRQIAATVGLPPVAIRDMVG